MKLTESRLKQMIKEEINSIVEGSGYVELAEKELQSALERYIKEGETDPDIFIDAAAKYVFEMSIEKTIDDVDDYIISWIRQNSRKGGAMPKSGYSRPIYLAFIKRAKNF